MDETWRKLFCTGLPSIEKEVLFLLIHNKLPVRERIFRIGQATDPYCKSCLETQGAIICDRQHFFCLCPRIAEIWTEVKLLVGNLMLDSVMITDDDLICLNFPKCTYDAEIVWLLAAYIHWVWKGFFDERSLVMDKGKFFGYLKFKCRQDQLGARRPLMPLWGLHDT